MNAGRIVIHGNTGDAVGYAMRGGEIYIKGNAGYRAGIHMKAYRDKLPVMVIGGSAGSFLGEYQAGGLIVVLGLGCKGHAVGNFPGTGMHGGKMFLRGDYTDLRLPSLVNLAKATKRDLEEIRSYVEEFCRLFHEDSAALLKDTFYVMTPNSNNPYHQMYVQN
jgi:glutamate synthase domain-containing protein 3